MLCESEELEANEPGMKGVAGGWLELPSGRGRATQHLEGPGKEARFYSQCHGQPSEHLKQREDLI